MKALVNWVEMSNSGGRGEDDVMWWKQFEKLYVSIINTIRHCGGVTLSTISGDVNSKGGEWGEGWL